MPVPAVGNSTYRTATEIYTLLVLGLVGLDHSNPIFFSKVSRVCQLCYVAHLKSYLSTQL